MKSVLSSLLPFGLALGLALAPEASAAAVKPRVATAAPVALVVGLEGEAVRTDNAGGPTPLRLFDKLAEGCLLETRAASGVQLVFAGGGRFALRASSRARIGRAEPERQSGTLTTLARVPAGLKISPIAPDDEPGDRFPTTVIRAQPMTGVYPRGAVTLAAEEAILRFDPVPGTEKYHLVVTERRSGNPVFALDTGETRVAVPASVLKPGTDYGWSVATVLRIGPKAEGKGGFKTYSPEAERARAALDATLAREPEADALLLKVAVDLDLGRFREVYEELQRAQAHYPRDEGLKAAIESWRRRLELEAPAGEQPAEPPRVSSKPPGSPPLP
jgi:hypothetical protein